MYINEIKKSKFTQNQHCEQTQTVLQKFYKFHM